jgi:hypothetical protein
MDDLGQATAGQEEGGGAEDGAKKCEEQGSGPEGLNRHRHDDQGGGHLPIPAPYIIIILLQRDTEERALILYTRTRADVGPVVTPDGGVVLWQAQAEASGGGHVRV